MQFCFEQGRDSRPGVRSKCENALEMKTRETRKARKKRARDRREKGGRESSHSHHAMDASLHGGPAPLAVVVAGGTDHETRDAANHFRTRLVWQPRRRRRKLTSGDWQQPLFVFSFSVVRPSFGVPPPSPFSLSFNLCQLPPSWLASRLSARSLIPSLAAALYRRGVSCCGCGPEKA